MRVWDFSRRLFGVSAAAAMLAGCGGLQPPISAPGAMPQSTTIATHAERGGSWMLPEARSSDLLYFVGTVGTKVVVFVLTYPSGKLVGKVNVAASQLCADQKGNVFMTLGSRTGSDSKIVEYAHGGTKPIATLDDPHNGASGCAVDPSTHNLAVTNYGGDGTVLIYRNAKGTPSAYDLLLQAPYLAYDGESNLFALGFGKQFTALQELPKGMKTFSRVRLEKQIKYPMGVQWDGEHLALGQGTSGFSSVALIRQYTIKGHRAIWKGGTSVDTPAVSFFIDGSTVIVSNGATEVDFFVYPGGGLATKKIQADYSPRSLVVSIAPTH
ncbi:MAG: hypothetical protein WCC84_02520 [Candidatus Cybelea sp.]